MHTLTIDRAQLDTLAGFLRDHPDTEPFVAKDQGAYFGASVGAGPHDAVIFYFPGCHPDQDADWWETMRAQFGGDDWGVTFERSDVLGPAENPLVLSLRIDVTDNEIMLKQIERKQP